MRVTVAGATGVIGGQLVPPLRATHHQVVALSRSRRTDGAENVLVNAVDASAVAHAIKTTKPEAIVNLLTTILDRINARRMKRDFAATNLLRTEGTNSLISARQGAQLISESTAFAYAPGAGLASEDAALWEAPAKQFRPVLAAIQELEARTLDAGGLASRFGHLYGPGSAFSEGGAFLTDIRSGKLPLVGGGTAAFSFLHAHDAATAILAALGSQLTGVLNVVDDEPAPVSEWLPTLAKTLNAPKPKRAPRAIAKVAVGGWGPTS